MADQLYLSYWLRGFSLQTMLRHYEKLIRTFPASRLARGLNVLHVHAVSFQEPPLLEQGFDDPLPVDTVIKTIREYATPDGGYQLDTRWDLWQYEQDWQVRPARTALCAFGPEFETDHGEHLRIEFGLDAKFLPDPELPDSAHLVQSNIRSLLRLVHDLDDALPVERRQLWSESGENFADRLQTALQDG